ncbi:hypothetical protein FJT64_007444 [Amphibalanus amphitrite]|uniref:Uncharacterized protein n=1 Tax=Amphibalanus amphitrite TaxID=1232801 RepID=A0A6A4VTG5_AMPAM|nr:hypothetical protein FJT64_007444 [Amphibalanus amphitrite]
MIAAPSDCSQLTQLCLTGPEVTKPRWPGWVEPDTVILPAGVGDSELTELRSSRETVERLSVTATDLPRLRGQLPEGLEYLNVRGPEVTEPRWPGRYPWDDLSVSLQGVTADTISHLADLGRTVTLLEIYDCTDQTAGSLEPLTRCRGLLCLSVTAADLPLLRGQLLEGLRLLNVRGPEVTEPRWPGWNLWGDLSVSLQGVAADTISHLADLGRTVKLLEIYDCPDLTAGSLEPLTRCPELESLTLPGGVPDAVLDSLSGWPGLKFLKLGDRQRPAETAFTAAAYTRLVKSCRALWQLYLHCTADTGRAVLTALKEADLGRRSDGRPRFIYLFVPGHVTDGDVTRHGHHGRR